MFMTIWKSVKGYEGIYEVSTRGQIRSLDRIDTYVRNHTTVTFHRKGTLLVPRITPDKYLGVVLQKKGAQKHVRVHRIVGEAFINNPDNKPQINHKDGNKINDDVKNLEWVTVLENTRHAINTNLIIQPKGEQLSVLTEKDVLTIRKLWATKKLNQRQIARKYKVGHNCIWYIIHRHTWRHI